MSQGDGARVVVAPREISDLVYRCARTAGVAAGTASWLAVQWTDAAMAVAGTDAAEAARCGVAVRRIAFEYLSQGAEAFLVSEQLLDQIDDPGS